MKSGAWMMALTIALAAGSLIFILFTMVRSIRDERTKGRSIWREFGLSLALMALFFLTWFAHGVSEWQTYTDQQKEHGEEVSVGDFVSSSVSPRLRTGNRSSSSCSRS